MGEFALWGLFFILIAIALYGCFIAKFPSAFITLGAVLLAKFCMAAGEHITWLNLGIVVFLLVITMIVTRMAPKFGKKIAPYGKGGTWGTIVGSVIGLTICFAYTSIESAALVWVLTILTMLILPFLFAWIFELITQKQVVPALQSAGAATVVYVSTSLLKLIMVVYAIYLVFTNN